MAILTAGGIYKNDTGHLTGGHFISALTAQHTYDDVYLHTNFSSEEISLTNELKKTLQNSGVDHTAGFTVSAPYGITSADNFTAQSNLFDTFKAKEDYLQAVDKVILTTDISERDFRYIMTFVRSHQLEVIVFTCGEFIPKHMTDITVVQLDDSGIPNYHHYINTIKDTLSAHGFINREIAENRTIPNSKVQKSGKALIQLIVLAAAIVILFLGGFKLLESVNHSGADHEANIDWAQPVDHPECNTVETCMEVGDEYLAELGQYVDLHDEPHIYFENRSRTNFIDYDVQNFELTEREVQNELPAGKEETYTEIWNVFSHVFPKEHIEDINQYRLFSDGEGNTSAYVSITRAGTVLAIDVRDNTHKASQYRNLIHEFGHIYSLPIEDFDASCETTDIACIKEGTILGDHKERFWDKYDESWLENKNKSRPQIEGFYSNNVTDFYVPYQATNVKEDYAITFVKFITEKIPANSSQLRDVKVQSLYEDQTMVAMRIDILKSFVQYEKERAK